LRAGPSPELSVAAREQLADLKLERETLQVELRKIGSLEPMKKPQVYPVITRTSIPEVRFLSRGDPEAPVGEALTPRAASALKMLEPDLGGLSSSEVEAIRDAVLAVSGKPRGY